MSSGYSYKVFIDSSRAGHAFIGIYGPNGESQVWGYYPESRLTEETLASFSGSSYPIDHGILVRDDQWGKQQDTMHDSDWSTGRIEITKSQYDLMEAYICKIRSEPGTYFALGNNCTQFVENMLMVAGERSILEDAIAPVQLKWQLVFSEWLCKTIFDVTEKVSSLFATASTVRRRDPILVDLDGDGLETIGVRDGAYFDHDGNGFAEQTGWASSDDGLLVMDRNGDGLINDGKELFGDQTILRSGQRAADGFQALADLDSNADGIIDANDTAWTQLKVWQDIDGDGYSSSDELFSLSDLGITSINLNYTSANITDANGNTLVQQGTFTKTDGSTGQIGGFNLQRDTAYTIADEWLDVPETIAALPDLQSFGNAHNLHQTW